MMTSPYITLHAREHARLKLVELVVMLLVRLGLDLLQTVVLLPRHFVPRAGVCARQPEMGVERRVGSLRRIRDHGVHLAAV